MPSPASIARKSSRAHRSVTEFGSPDHVALKASGLYQATSVQDRIRQWQEHGAAVSVRSTTPELRDNVYRGEEEEEEVRRKRTSSKTPFQSLEVNKVRSSSTPRKRVVSDEHWKVDRGSDKHVFPARQGGAERKTVAEKQLSPRLREERKSKQAREQREERRRRRVEARAQKRDSGDRSDLEVKERTSGGGDLMVEDVEGTARSGNDDRTYTATKYAETLGRPPEYQEIPIRSKKGSFMDRTKEVFGMSDPLPVPSNRLPTIEAWLDEQPDPFMEVGPSKVRFAESSPVTNHDDDPQTRAPKVDSTASPPAGGLKRRDAHAGRRKRNLSQNDSSNKENFVQPKMQVDCDVQETWVPRGPTRLSTIASVESFQEPIREEHKTVEEKIVSEPTFKRSTRRKRNIKDAKKDNNQSRTEGILKQLAEDEAKYGRELRTLVDGVIPVLLQCVLSKSDAVAAAQFFTVSPGGASQDNSFTRSIVDMGVALERVKSLHNRIPLQNVDSLLSWSQTAHKAYAEYLKAWRLTLQDVVVNLAPMDGSESENNEDVMERDANGDIVNAEGDPVDIAYLMKRPLVSIRRLSKSLSSLSHELPEHPVAAKIAEDYRELTSAAKTRHQQEVARLEDEAAGRTDSTKCRDLQNMEPVTGVEVDQNRRVRARDSFDMTLFHSSGQKMDCKIEVILREDQSPESNGGDVLICHIEEKCKWLLFPPIDRASVSIRREEAPYDLVLMIRGRLGMGQYWHELLALKADDPQSVAEWAMMIGSNPLPPGLKQVKELGEAVMEQSNEDRRELRREPSVLRRTASIETIDIPLGEPSVTGIVSKPTTHPTVEKAPSTTKSKTALSLGGGLASRPVADVSCALPKSRRPSQSVLSSNKSTVSSTSRASSLTFAPSSLAPIEHVDLSVNKAEVPQVVAQPKSTSVDIKPEPVKVKDRRASSIPLTDAIRDTWSSMSGAGRKTVSQPSPPVSREGEQQEKVATESRGRRWSEALPAREELEKSTPPTPPKHKQISVMSPRQRNAPVLQPSDAQIRMDQAKGRLSHSPLRKEYRQLSTSNSEHSDSESPYTSDDDSQTSEDEYTPPKTTAPEPTPTAGTRTLAPSDSASQGPYRRVPSSATRPDAPRKEATAMVCSWNDAGSWDPLIDEYCVIVVSPGLMEAFLTEESQISFKGDRCAPLAAFELTPMVPLRKPTGLDINIRSPPAPNSQIKTSNNVMFRSRTSPECEALYQMINWARCNNPTYIQLERDRPRTQPAVIFSNEEAPRPRSWFSFGGGMRRRNSYRVGNIPPSSMGETQVTTNTVSSAMSALRRLTKGSPFNVNRSSVIRRPGTHAEGSIYSSSNGSTPPPSQAGFIPGKDGPNVPPTSNAALHGGMVHNLKVKLFVRQDQGWVIVGPSRLSVLPAVKNSTNSPETSRPGSSGDNVNEHSRRASTGPRLPSADWTPHRRHGGGREKRVVITGEKDDDKILFDVTLGETCFERINQTGIAVQVWTSFDDIQKKGGVLLGQNTKYLLRFYQEKECAWVFDLVGRYRYSH